MPIEIRELVIKASIGDDGKQDSNASSNLSQGADTEAIVNICVEKVLEIIKEKTER